VTPSTAATLPNRLTIPRSSSALKAHALARARALRAAADRSARAPGAWLGPRCVRRSPPRAGPRPPSASARSAYQSAAAADYVRRPGSLRQVLFSGNNEERLEYVMPELASGLGVWSIPGSLVPIRLWQALYHLRRALHPGGIDGGALAHWPNDLRS
jgi:hypothetical protein